MKRLEDHTVFQSVSGTEADYRHARPKRLRQVGRLQCQCVPRLPETFVRDGGKFLPGTYGERCPVEELLRKIARFHRFGKLVGDFRFSEQNLNIHSSPAYSNMKTLAARGADEISNLSWTRLTIPLQLWSSRVRPRSEHQAELSRACDSRSKK